MKKSTQITGHFLNVEKGLLGLNGQKWPILRVNFEGSESSIITLRLKVFFDRKTILHLFYAVEKRIYIHSVEILIY